MTILIMGTVNTEIWVTTVTLLWMSRTVVCSSNERPSIRDETFSFGCVMRSR